MREDVSRHPLFLFANANGRKRALSTKTYDVDNFYANFREFLSFSFVNCGEF